MNVLEYEKAKLAVLQSKNIVLFDNSIEIQELKEVDNRKIRVSLNYAETDFVVIIYLTSPLDFLITSPDLLPPDYLLNKKIPPDSLKSLSSLLSWLTLGLKNYNRSRHAKLDNTISDLSEANIVDENNYELMVTERKATLYLKFPIEDLDLVCFMESVRNNKLINSTEHYFVLKIVNTEAKDSMDFSLTYSSCLLSMLPGLKTSPVELTQNDNIVTMVSNLKDTVIKKINDLHRDRKARASFLLPLYQAFDEAGGETLIDFDTMTELQLGFAFESRKALLEISLPYDYPSNAPQVCLSIKPATSRAKKYDLTSEFPPDVFSDVEQFHGKLLKILREYLTTD